MFPPLHNRLHIAEGDFVNSSCSLIDTCNQHRPQCFFGSNTRDIDRYLTITGHLPLLSSNSKQQCHLSRRRRSLHKHSCKQLRSHSQRPWAIKAGLLFAVRVKSTHCLPYQYFQARLDSKQRNQTQIIYLPTITPKPSIRDHA